MVLVTGAESLLVERAVAKVLREARATAADVELAEVDAVRLDAAGFAELTNPSLFSAHQVAVINDVGGAPTEVADAIVTLAAAPPPDLVLVLVHLGGNRGKGLLDRLKRLGVTAVDCVPPRAWELPQFVAAEADRAGGAIARDAATFLVDAVGHDLRALSAAVAQLVADGAGGSITVGEARRYFAGRSEVTSFAVADAALAGRTSAALEQLRWAVATGVVPVLITSALAAGLRSLAKLVTAPAGLREADMAREVGVPPWKLKSVRAQARGWDQAGLARALRAVARADAEVKGAAGDPAYALERAVMAVSEARGS